MDEAGAKATGRLAVIHVCGSHHGIVSSRARAEDGIGRVTWGLVSLFSSPPHLWLCLLLTLLVFCFFYHVSITQAPVEATTTFSASS